MTANDRRKTILEVLSDRREENMQNLAFEFNVSERTIMRDIEMLTCSAPVYTVQGNTGGIRVADGWYVSRRYMSEDDENILRKMLPGLQTEQQDALRRVLSAFAKPKINNK